MSNRDSVDKSGIVINRMYVGDYLASNLGHEVINLYQADNGQNYIYLNSTGDFVKAHQGKIEYMLFVKYYGIGEVEVIGMAKGLHDVYNAEHKFANKYGGVNEAILAEQKAFVEDEGGISYGGVPLFDIFGKAGQQSVYITYKADKVYTPARGKRLFIRFRISDTTKYPIHSASDIVVELEGYQQAKASLKQYIYASGTYDGDITKKNLEEKRRDYANIRQMLIDDKSLWIESNNRVDDERYGNHTANQHYQQFTIGCKDFKPAFRYRCVYQTENAEWCELNYPMYNFRYRLCPITNGINGLFTGQFLQRESDNDSPEENAQIVCFGNSCDRVARNLFCYVAEYLSERSWSSVCCTCDVVQCNINRE